MSSPSKASSEVSPAEVTPRYLRSWERVRVITPVGGDDAFGRENRCVVQRSAAEKCDINRIVKRYGQTGVWDHLAPVQPTYGDFTGVRSLDEAYSLIRDVEEQFYALPADVREKARNSPLRFAEMLTDPDRS